MLVTLEGIYKDGHIKLLEYPAGVSEARVLVTLLPKTIQALQETFRDVRVWTLKTKGKDQTTG